MTFNDRHDDDTRAPVRRDRLGRPMVPEKPWVRAERIDRMRRELERCPGVPHPATFAAMMRKWLAPPPR